MRRKSKEKRSETHISVRILKVYLDQNMRKTILSIYKVLQIKKKFPFKRIKKQKATIYFYGSFGVSLNITNYKMYSEEYFDENLIASTKLSLRKLKSRQEFLAYLDEEGILKELQVIVIHYEKTVNNWPKKGNFIPPFRFQLKLDLIKIQEVSENLLYLFIKEPDIGLDLAKSVILCGIQLMQSNIKIRKSDLQVIPLIVNLPVTCDISDLLKCPSLGLECVQGVLMNKTTLVKYVRSSVYCCELKYCPRNKWQRYPENFGNICPDCVSLMVEDYSSTDTGECFICQLISLKAYQSLGRFQVLNVKVKDELCTSTKFIVGEEYKVIGKLTGNVFEAMNITVKPSQFEMKIFSSAFPKSIMNLYYTVRALAPNCPWSFVYALSSPLGSHLIPASSYLHLKMGLILSLSTQKCDEASSLVAVGSDLLNTQYLFQIVGKLAERYVQYSTAHSYLGGAAKPGFQADIIWLEAGQLILATTGVCNLGDWSKFKKDQANYICQTIESGQVVLNKGGIIKTNSIDFAPLKCAVWTYWCHITTSFNHQLQLKTLINVFGIPFLAEEKNELEIKKICWQNLQKGRKSFHSTNNNTTIPNEDFREFIKIINTNKLCLSDSATQLIRNYFVVSRRERPHCLPIGAIKKITSLAEAHARLALRDEVLYEDVVAIIYLYEESISALFGESMNPYPKLIWNQEEPIYVFVCELN